MKSLKFVFAIIALAIAFGGSIAKAQDAKKQSPADRAKAAYNLTDEQYAQVKAIYADAAAQKKALPKDETRKAKDAAINKETSEKIRAVLTAEQQAKFDDAQKKAKGKGKGDAKAKGDAKKKKAATE